MLMAEIEDADQGDQGRVREWMARAMRASGDPAWTADGAVAEHWLPVSPNGRLDGFEWKVPLEEIGDARPVIEVTPPAVEVITLEAPTRPSTAPAMPPRKAAKSKAPDKRKPVEPVIPLVHAPDDPGPDPGADGDLVPELSTSHESDGWQRLRRLFR
jgi:HemY protein